MAVELYSDEILPGSCCIERVGEGEILLAAGEEEEVLLVPPAVLKHHHGAHRAVKSPHPSVPICLYPHKTKEVNACTPGTLRAVLDVSRIMSMKQAFKPVTPITALVPGMGDAKSGKTCCPPQCLRGPVVIWGRALHCPGEHAVLLELLCVSWKGLFQPLLPPSFPAVKRPHIFKFIGPRNSRGDWHRGILKSHPGQHVLLLSQAVWRELVTPIFMGM